MGEEKLNVILGCFLSILELHHQGECFQHSENAMSYEHGAWKIELYAALLAQFVCSTKPLISLSGWSCWH